jgi:hypothetical protein
VPGNGIWSSAPLPTSSNWSLIPYNNVRKVCALVAASLILPALAYADHDNDKDSYRDNHGRGDKDDHYGDPRISAVPEANTGIVLIPFVGAVLLFSSLQLLRLKAQKNGSLS